MSIEEVPTPEPSNAPDDREMCTICIEPLFDDNEAGAVRIFACGHKFHFACVNGGAKPITSCPNCRTERIGSLCKECFVKVETAFVIGSKIYYNRCPACVMSKLRREIERKRQTIFAVNRALMQLETQLLRFDETVEAGLVEHKEGYHLMKTEISQYFAFMDKLIADLI